MRCTRIMVMPGLIANGTPVWACVRATSDDTFVIQLEADLLSGGPPLAALLGHEIAHLVLNRCGLSHAQEEKICDLIGDILARAN